MTSSVMQPCSTSKVSDRFDCSKDVNEEEVGEAVVMSSAAATGVEEVVKTRDMSFTSQPMSAMAERLLHGHDVTFAPYDRY
jgi:hypothetical protein